MKIFPRFQKVSASLCFAAACLFTFGCGKSRDADMSSPALPHPQRAERRPAPRTALQAQMESLAEIAHEHDPNQRPFVVSERIAGRRAWVVAVLNRGYGETARTNAQWDAPALAALEAYADYARVAADERNFSALSNAVVSAVANGCDDPMIRYMQLRYGLTQTNQTPEQFALSSLNVFRSMLLSRYHPLLKFMAGLRAVEAAKEAEPKGNRSIPIGFVTSCLEDLARDTNAPAGEVFEAATLWLDHSSGVGWSAYVMSNLEGLLQKTWGREEAFYQLRGRAELDRAWNARGGGYANTVTQQGWEQFRSHLNQAAMALATAWQMNPSNAYTAYLMMRVELGEGQGRDRMEKWFHRAMNLYTNYYDAAHLMSYYLEPRWYGSEEQALQFARACVRSTNWGGNVPLVLADLHHSLATYQKLNEAPEYWHKPGVWEDIHSSYERFFELNPDNYGYRHEYARDAYLCGRYQDFLVQAQKFPWTNFQFFGGRAEFDKMVARASTAK